MRNFLVTIAFSYMFSLSVNAQLFDGINDILRTSKQDALELASGYTSPIGKTLTYALNSGWASSAKTHKKFGFGLSIAGVVPYVSDSDQIFKPSELTSLDLGSGESLPTVFGKNGGQNLYFDFNENVLGEEINYKGSIAFPDGLKDQLPFGTIPAPIVQASVGLFYDTDFLVRFVPSIKVEGSSFSLSGFGLKHNIMQYFGPLDKLPLNLSILAAVSKASFEYDLSNSNYFVGDSSGRKMLFEADTFTIQALGSIDLPVVSVFGGVGYNSGKSQFDVKGDYSLAYEIDGDIITRPLGNDPLSINSEASGVMGIIGARLNLLFLKIFANYTIQEYNTLTAGISFNFR